MNNFDQDGGERDVQSRLDFDEEPQDKDIVTEEHFRRGGLILVPKRPRDDDDEEALTHYANIVATQQQRQQQSLQDKDSSKDKVETEGKKQRFVFITPGYRKQMEARKIQINPRVLELAAQFGSKQGTQPHHDPRTTSRRADEDADLLYLNLRESSHHSNQK